jgi:hypothetical protein
MSRIFEEIIFGYGRKMSDTMIGNLKYKTFNLMELA